MKKIVLLIFITLHFGSCKIEKEYKKAVLNNNITVYTSFLRNYPHSKYSLDVKNRLNVLSDEIAWGYAKKYNTEKSYEQYIYQFPYGLYRYEAYTQQVSLANRRIEEAKKKADENAWQIAIRENNISSYRNYLKDFGNGKYKNEASQRINNLQQITRKESETSRYNSYNNNINSNEKRAWEIAKKTNTINSYKAYLKKYPFGTYSNDAEGKIIDKEVSSIMAGKHGELPSPQRTYSTDIYKTTVDINITNNTSYTLTVLYSGPSSKKIIISSGNSNNVSLTPGYYNVAAKVSASNVRPFAGTNNLQVGNYNSRFYIQTSNRYGGFPYNSF
jgi:hypothetical protein